MFNGEYNDISPEENEYNFYKMLEELEHQPMYMSVSLEDFLLNQTDNGAKILWLKYTKLGKDIPKVVMDRMIDVIEYEVLGFSSKLYLSPDIDKIQVLGLIHLAISKQDKNIELFWDHLHNPEKIGLMGTFSFDEKLLDSARKTFPRREKLSNTKLYEFAVEYLQIENTSDGKDLVGNMRKRYERFVKHNNGK